MLWRLLWLQRCLRRGGLTTGQRSGAGGLLGGAWGLPRRVGQLRRAAPRRARTHNCSGRARGLAPCLYAGGRLQAASGWPPAGTCGRAGAGAPPGEPAGLAPGLAARCRCGAGSARRQPGIARHRRCGDPAATLLGVPRARRRLSQAGCAAGSQGQKHAWEGKPWSERAAGSPMPGPAATLDAAVQRSSGSRM